MSSEPNILVERHHIPLSVYFKLYGAPQMPFGLYLQNPIPNTNRNNNNNLLGQQVQRSGQTTNNSNNMNTFRTTRRTNGSMHNDVDGLTTQSQFRQEPRSNISGNSRIRIETMASGDENDINLFNELFTALINPSRMDGNSSNTTENGLTQEQIVNNSTIVTFEPTNTDIQLSSSICSICTLEYESQQQVRSLNCCNHCFHVSCIDRWLADHNTCPLCRGNVIPISITSRSRMQQTSLYNTTSTRNPNLSSLNRVNLNDID
jgi:hypothetical protein